MLPNYQDGKFITDNWVKAGDRAKCFVIGDLNIDQLKWTDPDFHHLPLINMVKNKLEVRGFNQLVSGPTRFWPNCEDSLVDHVWTNTPDMIISVRNITDSVADHNIIEMNLRLKGKCSTNKEVIRRIRTNFDILRFRSKISMILSPSRAHTLLGSSLVKITNSPKSRQRGVKTPVKTSLRKAPIFTQNKFDRLNPLRILEENRIAPSQEEANLQGQAKVTKRQNRLVTEIHVKAAKENTDTIEVKMNEINQTVNEKNEQRSKWRIYRNYKGNKRTKRRIHRNIQRHQWTN